MAKIQGLLSTGASILSKQTFEKLGSHDYIVKQGPLKHNSATAQRCLINPALFMALVHCPIKLSVHVDDLLKRPGSAVKLATCTVLLAFRLNADDRSAGVSIAVVT
jgi:hypothetical protein